MSLSAPLQTALENLRRKKAGEDVGWINIADARALTELGLAERNRGGWNITSAGIAATNDAPPRDLGMSHVRRASRSV